MKERDFDVVVLGAGASGVTAAITSAELGMRVVLVDRGPFPGGELVGGLPILGSANSRGDNIVTGVLTRLIKRLDDAGGYVGRPFDWRTMWGVCFDPELMKLVVVDELRAAGVELRLSAQAVDVIRTAENRVQAVVVHSGGAPVALRAQQFIDASGDAWLTDRTGGPTEQPVAGESYQPLSLTFRMSNVNYSTFLEFVRENPDELIVAENPIITESEAQAAAKIAESGLPFVAVGGNREGSRLSQAIEDGRMFPTTAFYTWPTSLKRREVGLNVTRIAGPDGSRMESVSQALPVLAEQVWQASAFLQQSVPGYEDSSLSMIAPKVGIRETRRIVGEDTLSTEDVLQGRKREDGVARGGHHVDIHGGGTYQLRKYIDNGGSFDIPYGALVPRGIQNVIVAGRCLSSSREANGSARVIGPCIAMGEAAGVAAGLAVSNGIDQLIEVPVSDIRAELRHRGALADPAIP